MKREREFVIPCSNVVDDIWWPERSCFSEEELTEIVRCKDCVNYDYTDMCEPVPVCLFSGLAAPHDGFCHNGRRRNG